MANGHAAALLTFPQILEPLTAQVPQDTPAIELEKIGEAVAAAACAVAAAVEDGCRQGGVVDPAIKIEGGSRIAKVAELALNYMGSDADFTRMARVAGSRALRRHFDDSINPHLIDRAIDASLDPVFEIVAGVVRDERVFRRAWAN